MAVFNAPFDSPDYVYKAVCAARDIAAGSDRIASTFLEQFGKKVSYGIGVNCGDAVVGNIGSQFRMDYTAIGDTVNTAARLEGNAKKGDRRCLAVKIGKVPKCKENQDVDGNGVAHGIHKEFHILARFLEGGVR